ncbi:hypothetical protein [Dongia mobilis]|uniref:hypothetical protein n=1 Tax=Dongia sp. TaxID=1977262 RepID=UPI0026EB9F01
MYADQRRNRLRVASGIVAALALLSPTVATADFKTVDGRMITLEHLSSHLMVVNEMPGLPPSPIESESESSTTLNVLGDKKILAWVATNFFCQAGGNYQQTAIVYTDGRNSGSGTCDERISGTDVDSTTQEPVEFEFQSESRVSGTEIRLKGTFSAELVTHKVTKEGPFAGTSDYEKEIDVKQEAVLSINGKTCKVISLTWIQTEIEYGEIHNATGTEGSVTTTIQRTTQANDATTCTIQ